MGSGQEASFLALPDSFGIINLRLVGLAQGFANTRLNIYPSEHSQQEHLQRLGLVHLHSLDTFGKWLRVEHHLLDPKL